MSCSRSFDVVGTKDAKIEIDRSHVFLPFFFPVASFCGNNGVLCSTHFARGRNLHGPDVLQDALLTLVLVVPRDAFQKDNR